MKRVLATVLALALCVSFVACGNISDKPIINNEINDIENTQAPNDTAEEEVYSNKVYYVGDDIPVGRYAIRCTKTSYNMKILIFESEQNFKGFQDAKKSTWGEYQEAVGSYAWAEFYLEENEYLHIGLNAGYVIVLDNGMCEFNKYDINSTSNIYSGMYVVGEDIAAGGYAFNCIDTEYSVKILVFESEQSYRDFHSADKSTNGAYQAAVEAYAWADFYVAKDEDVYLGLKEGFVIVLEGGICKFNKYDPSEAATIYSGVYVVGEDIAAGNLNMTYTTSRSHYVHIVVFENKDAYISYHKTDRTTSGEDTDAIEKYASANNYVVVGQKLSVKLKEGMVLVVSVGSVEYSVDNGPIIN